jgi:hypothetical protein
VFTRQVWAVVFQHLNLVVARPATPTTSFSAWWCSSVKSVPKDLEKGLNSLIILVTWEIWKHRNSCVFKGARPSVQVLLQQVSSECVLWCSAGATKLKELLSRSSQQAVWVLIFLFRLWSRLVCVISNKLVCMLCMLYWVPGTHPFLLP